MLTRTLRPLASICRPAQARLTPLSRLLATTTTTATTTENTASSTAAPRAKVPYFVGKNKFDNFGVYHKTKAGGNLKTTEIKMVEGNVGSLKEDLKTALQLGNGDIAFNNTTRHLVIKVGLGGVKNRGRRRDADSWDETGTHEAAGHQLFEQHGVLRSQKGAGNHKHCTIYHIVHFSGIVSIFVKATRVTRLPAFSLCDVKDQSHQTASHKGRPS